MLTTVLLLFAATVAAQPAPEPAAVSYADIGLEQIMADPDWIGPPVEKPHWMLDGSRVLFQLKRDGSPVHDLYEYSLHDGQVRPVLDPALETLDGPVPVFDRALKRSAFVRNGDVFVRDLDTGALTQVFRGAGPALPGRRRRRLLAERAGLVRLALQRPRGDATGAAQGRKRSARGPGRGCRA